jgi:hypothetical protein
MTNWRLGNFFLFHFKGTPSQNQQKTLRRRLITVKVTLTDFFGSVSQFTRSYSTEQYSKVQYSTVQYSTVERDQLRKVTLRGYINSVL